MTIMSTTVQRTIEQYDEWSGTEYTIAANPHTNQYGNEVTNNLYLERYDQNSKWFVNYELDEKTVLRIFDHMDRKVWNMVWSEFRRIQH